jgi:hypothetical protein
MTQNTISAWSQGPMEIQDRTQALVLGPWRITDTVYKDRKNLFCLAPKNEHHIGTIISGSSSNLERFERSLQIIKNAPEMLLQLQSVHQELMAIQQQAVQLHGTSQHIDRLIERTKAAFIEG